MNSQSPRDLNATDIVTLPVQSQDRFARTDGRPQRSQPLMRLIEAAHLLPDHSIAYATHRVPCRSVFDAPATAFARGTLIPAQGGPIAIEDLLPGDRIVTSLGVQPVLWIGSTFSLSSKGPVPTESAMLTRILTGSFGPSRPSRDLVLGAGARMKMAARRLGLAGGPMGAVLVPVRDIVDGMGAIEVTPPSPVQLFHIATAQHATFLTEGIEVETYHPGTMLSDRLGVNGLKLLLSLFPHVEGLCDFGPLCLPRDPMGEVA